MKKINKMEKKRNQLRGFGFKNSKFGSYKIREFFIYEYTDSEFLRLSL